MKLWIQASFGLPGASPWDSAESSFRGQHPALPWGLEGLPRELLSEPALQLQWQLCSPMWDAPAQGRSAKGLRVHRRGLDSTEVLSDQRPKDSVTSWRWWQRRVSWSADMGLREEQEPDKRPPTSPRWGSARVGARRVGENLTPTELRLRESPWGRKKQKGATMWRWQPTSIWSIHLGIHNVPKVGPHSKCHQSRVKRRPSGVFPPQSATISTWCSSQGTVNLSSWRTPTAFQLCDVWQCTRFSLSYTGEQHVAPSWGGCENPVRWCSPALGRVSWSTAMLTTIPAKVTVSPTCHNHHRLERDSEAEVTPGHGMFW